MVEKWTYGGERRKGKNNLHKGKKTWHKPGGERQGGLK